MLYVLVNNNYQLQALKRHGVEALANGAGAALIAVPHALSMPLDADDFVATYRFDTPLGHSRMPITLWRYRCAAREVARALRPTAGDTLLFFTEAEWLNQIVVQHFRAAGARIVMLEDGGFATYIPMSVIACEPLDLRERAIQAAYRLLSPLRRSRLHKVNGQLFPRLPDASIDAIGLYQNVRLERDVPCRRVRKPPRKPCSVRKGEAIFLNERMYDHYQDETHYLAGLRRLMQALTHGFDLVRFKFHPREVETWKQRIRALLTAEFPTVSVIERSGTIEEMIQDFRPEVLASYFSAGLLSLEYEGIEPMYLYTLLDDLKDQPAFTVATRILASWGYRFPATDHEVRSGYRSGITSEDGDSGIALAELLAQRPAGRPGVYP